MVKKYCLLGLLVAVFTSFGINAAEVREPAKPTLLIVACDKNIEQSKGGAISDFSNFVWNKIGREFKIVEITLNRVVPSNLIGVNYVIIVSLATSEDHLQRQTGDISEKLASSGLDQFDNKAFVFIRVGEKTNPYYVNPNFARSFADGIFELNWRSKGPGFTMPKAGLPTREEEHFYETKSCNKMMGFIYRLVKRFKGGELPAPAQTMEQQPQIPAVPPTGLAPQIPSAPPLSAEPVRNVGQQPQIPMELEQRIQEYYDVLNGVDLSLTDEYMYIVNQLQDIIRQLQNR